MKNETVFIGRMYSVVEFNDSCIDGPTVGKSGAIARRSKGFYCIALGLRANPHYLKVRVTVEYQERNGFSHENKPYDSNSNLFHWLYVRNAHAFILDTISACLRKTFSPIWTSIPSVLATAILVRP